MDLLGNIFSTIYRNKNQGTLDFKTIAGLYYNQMSLIINLSDFSISEFQKEVYDKLVPADESTKDDVILNIYKHLIVRNQKKKNPIIQEKFIQNKSTETYHVIDYDNMIHKIKATSDIPFIKFTKRVGDVSYKIYKDFVVPESWFTKDEDIDFIAKLKKTEKIRKDVDDMYVNLYIKKLSDTDSPDIIIIERENISSLEKHYKSIITTYTQGDPLSVLITGESKIYNSMFTPQTRMFFTDYIFFESKYFEFDESKNTVGAKKDRYFLKLKKTNVRISFTKIFDNVFTLNITKVKFGEHQRIIDLLIEDLYIWNASLERIQKDYDKFFESFTSVHTMRTDISTPKIAGTLTQNLTQTRNKRLQDSINKLIEQKYNDNDKKAWDKFVPDYARKCQKDQQPYYLDGETDKDLEAYLLANNIPQASWPNYKRTVRIRDGPKNSTSTRTIEIPIACATSNPNESFYLNNPYIYPYGKSDVSKDKIYPCCAKSIQPEQDTLTPKMSTTTYIQTTTNKTLDFGKMGQIDWWWTKYCKICQNVTENYIINNENQYIRYSLGATPDSLLRVVLFSADPNFPISDPNMIEKYMIEKDMPSEVIYNNHIADISRTYKLNVVVFIREGTILITEATPSFDPRLNTILCIYRDKNYELVVNKNTKNPIFTSTANPNMYIFLKKLYGSYQSYNIIKNNFIE